MLHQWIDTTSATFVSQQQSVRYITELTESLPGMVRVDQLGESEEGRPIIGVRIGLGKRHISLMAGAHADEPVGPATLRLLIEQLIKNTRAFEALFDKYTLFIIPHINPDGEARNQSWIDQWPDPFPVILNRDRELPGRDIEFGYPKMRVENQAASEWWQLNAPFEMHINLHGMSISEGALLLISRDSIESTRTLQQEFQQYIQLSRFGFHDHDRQGEKGFTRIAKGLATTPESDKMREHFNLQGDTTTASAFHLNSMEFIASLGGSPVSLVTEFPLFKLPSTAEESPGNPEHYLRFRERLPEIQNLLQQGKTADHLWREFHIEPVPLSQAVRMQLKVIELGIHHLNRLSDTGNHS